MSTRYRTADVDTFTGHLTYALGAGDLFDVTQDSEYVQTLVGASPPPSSSIPPLTATVVVVAGGPVTANSQAV